MRPTVGYAIASLLLVVAVTGLLRLALGPETGFAAAVAAGVAYPIMVGSFALMVRFRGRGSRFIAAWIGGVLLRLLVLGLAVVAVVRVEALRPAPTLLALAGYFFALLLLEPVFFRRAAGDRRPPGEEPDDMARLHTRT